MRRRNKNKNKTEQNRKEPKPKAFKQAIKIEQPQTQNKQKTQTRNCAKFYFIYLFCCPSMLPQMLLPLLLLLLWHKQNKSRPRSVSWEIIHQRARNLWDINQCSGPAHMSKIVEVNFCWRHISKSQERDPPPPHPGQWDSRTRDCRVCLLFMLIVQVNLQRRRRRPTQILRSCFFWVSGIEVFMWGTTRKQLKTFDIILLMVRCYFRCCVDKNFALAFGH